MGMSVETLDILERPVLDGADPQRQDLPEDCLSPPAAQHAAGAAEAGAPRFESPQQVRTLLMMFLPRLRLYALALTDNAYDADDLTQELVVRVLGAQDRFVVGTNFRAWCYAILRNEFINARRQAARQRVSSPYADGGALLIASDGTQELGLYTHEVIRAMARLPANLCRALTSYTSGMSYSDVASDAGIRIGTVRSRVSRARAAVRAAVCEAEDWPVLTCESPGCTWNIRARAGERELSHSPL
jgi:RNA polymerase sigma-70 factor (ECF subfamily)